MVAAALLASLCVAGCSSATVRPQPLPSHGSTAVITGFASVSLFGAPAGPVTIRISGSKASRLALLVSHLPSVAPAHCEEPLSLMYRIVFGAGSVAHSKAVVEGTDATRR
jgi:hypothetical protein